MLQGIEVAWGAMPPMASPGELKAVLAEAVGLPEATLISHDRLLSEAGLRSKSGRGSGAARVSARDAAVLLTAVLGSPQVRDSVHTVQRYAASRLRRLEAGRTALDALGIAELADLPSKASFIDTLEALIAAVASGSLRAAVATAATDHLPLDEIAPLIEVTAQTPGTVGEIRLAGIGDSNTASLIFALPDPFDEAPSPPPPSRLKLWERQAEGFRRDTDLTQQRRVTASTIIRLGELLTPVMGGR